MFVFIDLFIYQSIYIVNTLFTKNVYISLIHCTDDIVYQNSEFFVEIGKDLVIGL